ncbi:ABC transporter permease [Paenibacillus terrigena]|uniref:ABC transporter permease n=1 Tax=Paenibacillus terrigena TaxID=369333 RepID=UPI0028D244CA|nr:ABC transporter permease [Paenibacillus terrigena]
MSNRQISMNSDLQVQEGTVIWNKSIRFLRRFQSLFGLLIIILAATILCTRDGENLFLSPANLANVVRSVSENGIMAIGLTLVILIGGIDLSVGAILGLAATGAADLMMHRSMGMFETVLIVLAIGAALGMFNGVISTKLRIQPFIVTLAAMSIARGIARYWSNGTGIPISYGQDAFLAPPAFSMLSSRIWGIPVPALCFIGLGILFTIMLKYTRFGRHVYAIGGNETAAHLSGIPVIRIKIFIFALCGVLAAIAGLIHASQLSQGSPNDGIGYELNAIAAAAIGGTNLAGGKGTIIGTLIGALILGVLDNMLGLLNVNTNIQSIVKGLIIIAAVYLQKQK